MDWPCVAKQIQLNLGTEPLLRCQCEGGGWGAIKDLNVLIELVVTSNDKPN
jgi:hypothetical protein